MHSAVGINELSDINVAGDGDEGVSIVSGMRWCAGTVLCNGSGLPEGRNCLIVVGSERKVIMLRMAISVAVLRSGSKPIEMK